MTNNFFAIDPQGRAHTRTSKSRSYTHTVIFLRGEDRAAADLAFAQRSTMADSVESHDTNAAWAQGKNGTLSAFERKDAAAGRVVSDYLIECGKKHLAKWPTAEALESDSLARRLANHAQRVAKGHYTEWQNAGWCGRPDLARKLVAKGNAAYQHLILEAQAGKPPKA